MTLGIAEGVASDVVVSTGRALIRRVFGTQIQIMLPLNGAFLEDQQPMGDSFSYVVRGKLKRLPRDHAIWLLNEDPLSGRVWPQGFFTVRYPYPREGEWEGRVFVRSSQTDVGSEPLIRVPVECTNMARVQARKPIAGG